MVWFDRGKFTDIYCNHMMRCQFAAVREKSMQRWLNVNLSKCQINLRKTRHNLSLTLLTTSRCLNSTIMFVTRGTVKQIFKNIWILNFFLNKEIKSLTQTILSLDEQLCTFWPNQLCNLHFMSKSDLLNQHFLSIHAKFDIIYNRINFKIKRFGCLVSTCLICSLTVIQSELRSWCDLVFLSVRDNIQTQTGCVQVLVSLPSGTSCLMSFHLSLPSCILFCVHSFLLLYTQLLMKCINVFIQRLSALSFL